MLPRVSDSPMSVRWVLVGKLELDFQEIIYVHDRSC